MMEVTVKVPQKIGEIISETSQAIYVEALREVARKRLSYTQKRLAEISKQTAVYESKYGKSFEEFSESVPDTMEGHDDWTEWSYLDSISKELRNKVGKLKAIARK